MSRLSSRANHASLLAQLSLILLYAATVNAQQAVTDNSQSKPRPSSAIRQDSVLRAKVLHEAESLKKEIR